MIALGRAKDARERLEKIFESEVEIRSAISNNKRPEIMDCLIALIHIEETAENIHALIVRVFGALFDWAESATLWVYDPDADPEGLYLTASSDSDAQSRARNISLDDTDAPQTRSFLSENALRVHTDDKLHFMIPIMYTVDECQRSVGLLMLTEIVTELTDPEERRVRPAHDYPTNRERNSELTGYIRQVGQVLAHILRDQARKRTIETLLTMPEQRSDGQQVLQNTLNNALKTLKKLVPYRSASIQLHDKSTRKLHIRAARGFEDNEALLAVTFPDDEPQEYPNVGVFDRKQPRIISNLKINHPRMLDEAQYQLKTDRPYEEYSWLGVPLITEEECIGVITFDHPRQGFFTATDLEEAVLFASAAAAAIHLAQMTDQARENANRLSGMLDVRQLFDTDDNILSAITDYLCDKFNLSSAVIYRVEKRQVQTRDFAQTGLKYPDMIGNQSPDDGEYGRLFDAVMHSENIDGILTIDNVHSPSEEVSRLLKMTQPDGTTHNLAEHPTLKREGVLACAVLRLQHEEGKVVGVVFLNRDQVRPFSTERIALSRAAQLATYALAFADTVRKLNPPNSYVNGELGGYLANPQDVEDFIASFAADPPPDETDNNYDPMPRRRDLAAILLHYFSVNSASLEYTYMRGRQGKSGSAVCFFSCRDKISGSNRASIVIKIDRTVTERIEVECRHFLEHAEPKLNVKPSLKTQVALKHGSLSAIVYSLEGEVDIEDGVVRIRDLTRICRECPDAIPGWLDKLFDTMQRWFDEHRNGPSQETVWEMYRTQWKMNSDAKQERIRLRIDHMLRSGPLTACLHDRERLTLRYDDHEFISPEYFLRNCPPLHDIRLGVLRVVHGDLHPRNIILGRDRALLIDFHRTDWGHEFADFAKLETFLRFEILHKSGVTLPQRARMERVLASVSDLDEDLVKKMETSNVQLRLTSTLRQLLICIETIRKKAQQVRNSMYPLTLEEYFTALVFNGLQVLSWDDGSGDEVRADRREHALLMAAAAGSRVKELALARARL